MANLLRAPSRFPAALALIAASVSVLAGCPGSQGVDFTLAEQPGITLENDSGSELEVLMAGKAAGTVVDLATLEGNPDFIFDGAFAEAYNQTTVKIAAGGTTSISFPTDPESVLSIRAGDSRGLIAHRSSPPSEVPAVVHLGKAEVTTEGPIRFVKMNAGTTLAPCATVKTYAAVEKALPQATVRIDELVKEASGMVTLGSGATQVSFDGALFPYTVGDVVTFTSEPSGRRILPTTTESTFDDVRMRATSPGKPLWWLIRGNTIPESLRDELVLEAELGAACIERNEGRIAVAKPVRLVASGRPIPLGEAVTLDTSEGKLTVRTTEALVRLGLAQHTSFGPSFRMAAVRGDVR